VAGPTASLKTIAPVRDMQCRRFGDQVRVSWEWPDGATAALVTWSPRGSEPDVTVPLTRHAYRDNRGCLLDAGPDAGRVEVRVVAEETDASPPVAVHVPELGMRLWYEFRRRRRLFRPDRALLRLVVTRPCEIPELIVVHSTGPTLPLRPEQGEVIHSVVPRRLVPDQPYEEEITVPPARPSWLVCFPRHTDSAVLTRLRGSW
jgi:hypothetical protein